MSGHQLGPVKHVAHPPLGDIGRLAKMMQPSSVLVWLLTGGQAEAAGNLKAPMILSHVRTNLQIGTRWGQMWET